MVNTACGHKLVITHKQCNNMVMTKLSTQSYKGSRDYYPEDKRIQNYIFSKWHTVAQRHGYMEYGAPLLEPIEVYTAKSGQELAGEQTYLFTDRGGREVAIRPEMTPTISRMVAARRQELSYPARLYSIANFMRYERPQRGREREFWQFNADLFGVQGVVADAEIITLAYDSVKIFGAQDDDFVIKINHRGLIDTIMRGYLGLTREHAQRMIKLLDRKNKIPADSFREQANDILADAGVSGHAKKLERILQVRKVADLPSSVREHFSAHELQELFKQLHAAGVSNAQFDMTLMRGLDYYTGVVFEVMDNAPENNRSMFGGGRYDGLVGLFGVEPVATVGMAPGLSPMQLFLEIHGLLPELPPTIDMSILVLAREALPGALALARQLREEGVRVEVDITCRKLDKQLKAALKKKTPYIIFVGEDEIKQGQYTLKNTATEHEERVSVERIIATVRDRRHQHAATDELDELMMLD